MAMLNNQMVYVFPANWIHEDTIRYYYNRITVIIKDSNSQIPPSVRRNWDFNGFHDLRDVVKRNGDTGGVLANNWLITY